MSSYYLAVDFGASGGRHIAAHIENGRIVMREIYRFPNGPIVRDGHMCWDLLYLTKQLLEGMRRCQELGIIPEAMGIDTWGLDYVFLDRHGEPLGQAVNHRDSRTRGIYRQIFEIVPQDEIYHRTGIQMAEFNTLCQLMSVKRDEPHLFDKTAVMLMIPDYFNYVLTGVTAQEYSNASTTQLMKAGKREWDWDLIRKLGLPENLFMPVRMPGESLGTLRKEVIKEVGFDCRVILPPTHDTASAFLALPPESFGIPAISSGTWSLVGRETDETVLSEYAGENGFTNEGGFEGRNLLLKNSMGLWMIQSIRREAGADISYEQLCREAESASICSVIDCRSTEFMAPESMTEAVRQACRRSGQQIPETLGEMAAVVYRSLAKSYADIFFQMEHMAGRQFEKLCVVGGGARASYLNRLTAKAVGRPVSAGPAEATAVGNIMSQMISDNIFDGVEAARKCVADSFEIKCYRP